jgi:hypothetical protein
LGHFAPLRRASANLDTRKMSNQNHRSPSKPGRAKKLKIEQQDDLRNGNQLIDQIDWEAPAQDPLATGAAHGDIAV